jgi:hypothetical protein
MVKEQSLHIPSIPPESYGVKERVVKNKTKNKSDVMPDGTFLKVFL